MKLTLKIEKEFEAKILKAIIKVRYWEDAIVDGIEDTDGDRMPCRVDNNWCPVIDIDTGIIKNWIIGVNAEIHFKVCDGGTYELRDINGEIIVTKEGYVPAIMCPEENGFGDYIIMKINEKGQIANWRSNELEYFED